jgi:hypothetical protein
MTSQPDAESERMMVAARVRVAPGAVFAQRRSAKLARPDHERRVQQSQLLEVVYQGRHRLVGHLTVEGQQRVEVAVMVAARRSSF